jgi:chromosome segregation ATPase
MKTLLILLLIAGFGGSLYHNAALHQDLQTGEKKIQEQSDQLQKLEAALKKARAHLQTDVDAQRQVVDGLKGRLKTEQDLLTDLELRRDHARNGGVGGDDPAYYGDPIAKERGLIEDLKLLLAQNQAQQKGLKDSRSQAIGTTQQQELQGNQQLAAAITDGQLNLTSLQQQVLDLQPRRGDYQVKAQIQQLNQQIKDQKTQIHSMQAQQKDFNQQGKSTENAISGQTGAQMGDLRQAEAQLKQRLQAEQASFDQLKQQQKTASQSRSDQRNAISQMEKSYQDEKLKIQQLQQDLKTQEARLQEISI